MKLSDFHFRTWHFLILFIVLVLTTTILGAKKMDNIPFINNTCLVEVDGNSFKEKITSDISYVLFHYDNSELSNKMEHNLDQIGNIPNNKTKFLKVNISENHNLCKEYNISGAPSVIIFRNGEEVERMIGVIPVSNLQIIHNRVTK